MNSNDSFSSFALLILVLFPTLVSGQIITDCKSFTHESFDAFCGKHYGNTGTDAVAKGQPYRRSTQKEWDSCVKNMKGLKCPESYYKPLTALAPKTIFQDLANECSTSLSGKKSEKNNLGEIGPFHADWKKCLKSKGLHGIFSEYKNTKLFKEINKSNKPIREKYCSNFKKEIKDKVFKWKELVKDCEKHAKTGIALSIDEDEYSTHLVFSEFRPRFSACAVIAGERQVFCMEATQPPMQMNFSMEPNEVVEVEKFCQGVKALVDKKDEAKLCEDNLSLNSISWKKVSSYKKKLCQAKIVSSQFRMMGDRYDRLVLNGVVIKVSESEGDKKGRWQSLSLDSVSAQNMDEVVKDLKEIKSSTKSWLSFNAGSTGNYGVCTSIKGYDALNAISSIDKVLKSSVKKVAKSKGNRNSFADGEEIRAKAPKRSTSSEGDEEDNDGAAGGSSN